MSNTHNNTHEYDKSISIDNIPDELKECNQWILWKYDVGRNGKQTKVPYSPKGEKTGAQKARWDIHKMVECVETGNFSGVGFAFKESDDYIGIDYDAEKDKEGNIIKPLLDDGGEIIDQVIRAEVIAINSYTEISPSGAGIHIICKGKKPEGWKKGTNKGMGELYFSDRYFTVTGNKYKHSPDFVNEIKKDTLELLYYRLNPEEKEKKLNPFEMYHQMQSDSGLDEQEIISKLMDDQKARTLYLGNTIGYDSPSDADEALCCKIVFFTRNPAQIDSIFSSSGLYRPEKWGKRQDYRDRTITKALNLITEQYSSSYISPKFAQEIKIGEEIFNRISKNDANTEIEDLNKYDINTPPHILTIPGILGKVVEYYNDTAPKTQPQFAVQTALAIGSVAMGRRWVTDWDNYPSLYLINIGLSSAGKEHTNTVITEILNAADCGDLIGTSKYSSGSAVYSDLIDQPTHIGIIDEFGRLLGSTKKANNSHGMDALTTLMMMFSKLGSIAKIPSLSRLSMNKAQKDEMTRHTFIDHPAITLMAMTTPDTFYSAITMDNIKDGFIPRFIIVESEIGRQKTKKRRTTEINKDLINWIYRCSHAHSGAGNLSDVDMVDNAPKPVLIPVSDGAYELMDAFQDSLLKRMNTLDIFKIADILGKMHEISLRVSLIVAVSCGSFTIEEEHAKWAIDYVDYYSRQMVDKARKNVSDSDFEAICKQVVDYLKKKGNIGSTVKELGRECRLYGKSEPNVRDGVIRAIGDDYDLVKITGSHKDKGGRSATRYVLEEYFVKEDWILQ